MKTITRTSIYLPIAAMLLTAALTGPAVAAEKLVPFSGSLQAHESVVFQGGPPPGTFLVDGSGGGIATHLGRFTLTWKCTLDIIGHGPIQFIAANGDKIFIEGVGRGEPTDTPGVFRITEINTITGGTGRFANAKGSFTVERLTDLNTGFTSGSFHGAITAPGSSN